MLTCVDLESAFGSVNIILLYMLCYIIYMKTLYIECIQRSGKVITFHLLFGIFVNGLAVYIHSLNNGVNIGYEKVSILLYADDMAHAPIISRTK